VVDSQPWWQDLMPIQRLVSIAQPAIDGDGLSGHVVGPVGDQELYHIDAVFDRSFPSQRDPIRHPAPVAHSAGSDNPRGDTVDVDVVRAELLSQGAGIKDDR